MTNRFKNHTALLLTGIILLILSSCDPGSTIKYEIVNKTAKALKIKYQFPGGLLAHEGLIAVDSSKMINQETRLGYVDDINKRLDSIAFNSFTIQQEGKMSPMNLKDKKYWVFKKDNDQKATYTLTVDESFFSK